MAMVMLKITILAMEDKERFFAIQFNLVLNNLYWQRHSYVQ